MTANGCDAPLETPAPASRAVVLDHDPQRRQTIVDALNSEAEVVEASAEYRPEWADRPFQLGVIHHDVWSSHGKGEASLNLPGMPPLGQMLIYGMDSREPTLERLLREGALHTLHWEGEHGLRALRIAARKILGKHGIFGLDRYLPKASLTPPLLVVNSADRRSVVDACERFASRIALRARRTEYLLTVTDELLTNALYNAPTDVAGERMFAHLSRREPVSLGAYAIEVVFGSDTNTVGVAVRDPFGSLTADSVRRSLSRRLTGAPNPIAPPGSGGAGMGMYYSLRCASLLEYNIAPGMCTEAIGLLDTRTRDRMFSTTAKSLHVFVSDHT